MQKKEKKLPVTNFCIYRRGIQFKQKSGRWNPTTVLDVAEFQHRPNSGLFFFGIWRSNTFDDRIELPTNSNAQRRQI
jgi:hypothetical protein